MNAGAHNINRASAAGCGKAARSHRCAAKAGSLPLASGAHSCVDACVPAVVRHQIQRRAGCFAMSASRDSFRTPNQSFQPTSHSSLRSSCAAAELQRYAYFFGGWRRETQIVIPSRGAERLRATTAVPPKPARCRSRIARTCSAEACPIVVAGIKYRKERGASV